MERPMDMTNVIGPIDLPTWYCMRQCRESINYLTPLAAKNPIYNTEIEGEKGLLKVFMDEVLGRKAA
jgi:hypothetical protein